MNFSDYKIKPENCDHSMIGHQSIGGFAGHEHVHPSGPQLCLKCGKTFNDILKDARQPEVSALTAERDALKRELEAAQAACAATVTNCADVVPWAFENEHQQPSCASIQNAILEVEPNPGAPLIAELTKLREVVEAGDVFARATSTALHDWHLLPENVPLNLRDGEVHCVDSVCVTFRESLAAYLAAKSALEVKPLDRILNGRTAKIDPQDIGAPILREDK